MLRYGKAALERAQFSIHYASISYLLLHESYVIENHEKKNEYKITIGLTFSYVKKREEIHERKETFSDAVFCSC